MLNELSTIELGGYQVTSGLGFSFYTIPSHHAILFGPLVGTPRARDPYASAPPRGHPS